MTNRKWALMDGIVGRLGAEETLINVLKKLSSDDMNEYLEDIKNEHDLNFAGDEAIIAERYEKLRNDYIRRNGWIDNTGEGKLYNLARREIEKENE
jgi:hypothetical protein